jgi:hypothetical protein
VSGWVIEHQAIGRVLFNQQVLTVFFYDASHSNAGFPSFYHGAKSSFSGRFVNLR